MLLASLLYRLLVSSVACLPDVSIARLMYLNIVFMACLMHLLPAKPVFVFPQRQDNRKQTTKQKTPQSHILDACAAIVANTDKAEIGAKIDRRTSNGECMEECGVGRGSIEH